MNSSGPLEFLFRCSMLNLTAMNITQLLDLLFVFNALLFQVILITHFALRKWRFDTAMRSAG